MTQKIAEAETGERDKDEGESKKQIENSFTSLLSIFNAQRQQVLDKNAAVLIAPVAQYKNPFASFESSSVYKHLQSGLQKLGFYATQAGKEYTAQKRGYISAHAVEKNPSLIAENDATKNYHTPPKPTTTTTTVKTPSGTVVIKKDNAPKNTPLDQIELVETLEQAKAREAAEATQALREKAEVESKNTSVNIPAGNTGTVPALDTGTNLVTDEVPVIETVTPIIKATEDFTFEEIQTESGFKGFWNSLKENTKNTFIDLYQPLKTAGERNADAMWAYGNGDQGMVRTIWQYVGNTAGGVAGFVGEAVGGAINETVIALGWDDELRSLVESAFGTELGQQAIIKLGEGEVAWQLYEADHPAEARDLKAAFGSLNFLTMLGGAAATKQATLRAKAILKESARTGVRASIVRARWTLKTAISTLKQIDEGSITLQKGMAQLRLALGDIPELAEGNWDDLIANGEYHRLFDSLNNKLESWENKLGDIETKMLSDELQKKLKNLHIGENSGILISSAKGTTVKDLGSSINIRTLNKFESEISLTKDSRTLDIKNAFRDKLPNNSTIRLNDVIMDQIEYIGGKTKNIKTIKLSTVVNNDLVSAIKADKNKAVANFGYNSGIDGMARKLIAKMGKSIDSVEIGNFIPDGKTWNQPRAHYNIIINLK